MKTLHLLTLIAVMTISAQANTLTPAKDSTQAAVLQSQSGKQVELRLKSGEKISGKVAFVGDSIVHLTSLTGMEMFEASISIESISAVVVRSAK